MSPLPTPHPQTGEPLKYAVVLTFKSTKNVGEYKALINGFRLTKG